jgi:NAD(P)-dependent dehydrogenase (short-subunit alcohol dehydrogenase family)
MPRDSLFSVGGKTAVVTGGVRGLGRHLSDTLLTEGARVIATTRKAEEAKQAAEELGLLGDAEILVGDLASAAGLRDVGRRIGELTDRVDVLVHNAGRTWGAPLEEYPYSAFDDVFAVNVKAPFALTVQLLPLLRKAAAAAPPARVIMVGSMHGVRPGRFDNYAYTTSKAALHMLARHLALRLAPERITVNAMAPGFVPTRMMAYVLEDPAQRAEIESSIPLGRLVEKEDLAGAVLFLSSRAGAYLTGAVLPVDGGQTLGA